MNDKVASLDARRRGVGRLLAVATGKTAQNNRCSNAQMRWSDLVERAARFDVGTETYADYLAMTPDEQAKRKDNGWFMLAHIESGVRKKVNIKTRDGLALDLDFAPVNALDLLRDKLMGLGKYEWFVYSTRKHRRDSPRLRLVLPFTREVTEVEYIAIARKLAASIETGSLESSIEWFDDTTYEFSRLMYWPSRCADGEQVYHHNEGDWVDPDSILAQYTDFNDVSEWPVSEKQRNRLSIAGTKAGNPREKFGMVGAFCRTYDIYGAIEQFLPGVYVPGAVANRLTFTGGTSTNGAVVYDDALFLTSHHHTDPAAGMTLNAFDLVRVHLFGSKDKSLEAGTPITEYPSYKAMVELCKADPLVLADYHSDRISNRVTDFDDDGEEVARGEWSALEAQPETADAPFVPAAMGQGADWTVKLAKRFLLGDNGNPLACLSNLEAIFDLDPVLKGCVATNQFTGELLQMRRLPGMKGAVPPQGQLWSDLAELKIKSYIERKYRLYYTAKAVNEAACTVGDKRGFNPVRHKLATLPVWDGVKRIDEFFTKYLGAEDTPYHRAVSRKMFCAAVRRVFRPGCKFDHMVVLEGVEGIGKSRLCRLLAYDFFTDEMSFGFDSKEVVERSRGSWIIEVPEMVTRSNADSEHVKQFITRQSERVRLSYARNAGDFPRQFILIGTTNESDYLRSQTGNRRFWPVRCATSAFDFKAIEAVLDQLWAEALMEEEFEELFIKGEALEEAKAVQASRMQYDDLTGAIEAWLDKPIRVGHWDRGVDVRGDFDDSGEVELRDRTCALEVWVECLKEPLGKMRRADSMRIYGVLRRLGWVESGAVSFGARYGRTRGFWRPGMSPDAL